MRFTNRISTIAITSAFSLCVVMVILGQSSVGQTAPQQVVPTRNNPARDHGMQLAGRFQLIEGTNEGYLILKTQIPKGSYTYSVSQPAGGPPATKIQIKKDANFLVNGQFVADKKAEIIEKDKLFNMRIEKHRGSLQFFIPIKIRPGVSPKEIRPIMKIDAQICSEGGTCSRIQNRQIAAEFAGYYKQQAKRQETSQNPKR